MPRTYVYRLYHGQVAAAAGCAEIVMPNRCTIVGVHMSETGAGAAGVGYYSSEVAVNNNAVTNARVNYPPRNQTIASLQMTYGNGLAGQADSGYIPMNVPINSGDRVSVNQTTTGTNAAVNYFVADLYVQE